MSPFRPWLLRVLEMLIVALDEGALAEALSARGEQDDGVLAAVRQDEQALETLANDFYVEQLVSREEFFAARAGLTKRLEANRQQLARREARGAIGALSGLVKRSEMRGRKVRSTGDRRLLPRCWTAC